MKYKNLSLEVWHEGDESKARVMMSFDTDSKVGSRNIYMSFNEFENLLINHIPVVDVYTHVNPVPHGLLIYNLDLPNLDSGELNVPYVRLHMNWFIKKFLVVLAKKMIKQFSLGYVNGKYCPRLFKTIPDSTIQRLLRVYENGSGNIIVINEIKDSDISPDTNRESYDYNIETLKKIALNQTNSKFQKSKLFMSGTHDDIYFCIQNPKGYNIMNGGVVYHSSANEWCIHT